jgi:hypothetical protein
MQGAGEPTDERTTRESETPEKTTAKSSTKSATAPTTTSTSGCWVSKPCIQAITDLANSYAVTGNFTDPNKHDPNDGNDYNDIFQSQLCHEGKYEE